jgi:hypothetical protein
LIATDVYKTVAHRAMNTTKQALGTVDKTVNNVIDKGTQTIDNTVINAQKLGTNLVKNIETSFGDLKWPLIVGGGVIALVLLKK